MNDPWLEIEGAIGEIEWFVSRKKDLSALVEKGDRTWADVLQSDVDDLRRAIALIRFSPTPFVPQIPPTAVSAA